MDRLRTAEWILSLVFARDRAASITGDFSEKPLRFWTNVITTTVSGLWSDVTEHPLSFITLTARGYLSSALGSLSGIFLALFLTLPWDVVFAAFSVLKTTPPSWLRETSAIWGWCVMLAAQFLCQFGVGRRVARRAPGREIAIALAVCLPSLIFRQVALIEVNPFVFLFSLAVHQQPQVQAFALLRVFYVIAICAGALSVRLRTSGAATA